MPVDRGLDLFGMNFQAADIDDAAAPAGKEVTIAAQFHHVAGIDKAVLVGERCIGAEITRRGARRADAQRAVQHLHLDAIAAALDEFGGKSGKSVANLERHAGFGRGISVTDDGLRKGAVQAVEDRLVGDFARQPDVTRRNIADRRRHQRAAPMRRRSQQMRHAVAAEAIEMFADRLAGAGQNERDAAEHGAQKDLQAAIAADVVERPPHGRAVTSACHETPRSGRQACAPPFSARRWCRR